MGYEGYSFSDVRRSIEQEAAVRFIHNIQSTILRFAHSVPVVCAKIHRHFGSGIETVHGALDLLLLLAPEVNTGKFPLGQLFFDEGEQPNVVWSRELWGNEPEPRYLTPLGWLQ